MKRLLPLAIVLAASSAFAALSYDFRSVTTGMQNSTLEGSVIADAANLRMTVSRGDGYIFRSGSTVLSADGGKTLKVFDATTRTYYVLSLDQIVGSMAGMLKNGMFTISFQKPAATVRDGGDGGRLEGFRTRKSHLDASIDVVMDAMGQKMTSRLSMQSDSWTTDQLSGLDANIIQQQALRTGIDALDKLIEAQAASLQGRFPLKQVTAVHVSQNGHDLASTTTVTVSHVRQKAVDAKAFVEPRGYEKVDNPIEAMKKRSVR